MGLGFDHITAPPNQQVDEVTGLREQRSAFRFDVSTPRTVVIVPLVSVPQDIAFDHENLSEHAAVDGIFGQTDRHVVPVLFHHPQMLACFLRTGVHGLAVCCSQRHGLFHQHVIPCAHCCDAHVGMQRVGRDHSHHIKTARFEHFCVVRVAGEVWIFCELVLKLLVVVVANGDQLRARFGVQHGDVPFSNASASDDGEFSPRFFHRMKFTKSYRARLRIDCVFSLILLGKTQASIA